MSIEIQWLGHATVLVEDRARILTDPVLTAHVAHLRRRGGPVPAPLTDQVDAVVISHLHLDHLHAPSLRLLDAGTPVLVPRGGGRLLRRTGLEVVEVSVGDVVPVADTTLTVVPAVHVTSRWPGSPVRADTVGYVVRGEGTTYFAGDTSLFPEMADIAGTPDVALLPVGGWGPSRGAHHMDPADAATCVSTLGASVAVPIHYGTLWPLGMSRIRNRMFHEPGREFAARASSLAPQVDVRVLEPGTRTSVRLEPERDGRAAAR